MLVSKSEWWTDARIETTVTAHYIYSHLCPDEAEKLTIRVFATFSNDTYLEWILLKAKRLFITLVDAGISGQIFRLIDESYDDDDLPIAEEDLPSLRLPQARGTLTSQIFYRCQFRYLFRVIGEGEHVRYAKSEIIPVQTIQQKQLQLIHADDKVVVSPSDQRVFSRKTIRLAEDGSDVDILSEIASLKALNYDHIVSVFGSYTFGDHVCVLLQSLGKNTLKSFLNDTPKSFSALPKLERRVHLLSWANCIANAVAWLHMQNAHHGAIRPSRVHIDDDLRPCLGQFEGDGVLGLPTSKDDLEAYQYAAPEFWKRELTLSSQVSSNGRSDRSTQSRTGHRNRPDSVYGSVDAADMQSELTYAFMPTSKGNASRLKLETWNRRKEKPATSNRQQQRANSRLGTVKETPRPYNSLHQHFDTLSMRSTNSSDAGKRAPSAQGKALYYIAAESRHAVVETWKSSVSDPAAADIFALAAIIMELLTMLCSRTTSAFSKHRASKNRQAGRGGGMADSSFHANLPQVASWAEILHKEAEKRIKKSDGAIFKATGPMLQMLILCLDRDPCRRMQGQSLAKRLQKHILEFAGLTKLHCDIQKLEDKKREKTARAMELEETMLAGEKSATPSQVSSVSHNAPTVSRGLDDFEYNDAPTSSRRSVYLPESTMKSQSPRYFGESRGLPQDKIVTVPPRLRLDTAEHSPISSIEYRDRVTIEPSEDGSGDDSPPQSMYSGSRSTGTFMHERSEPTTPSTMSTSFRTANAYASHYSQSPPDSKPPNRGLPPVPPIPSDARSASSSRPHSSERSSTASRKRHAPPSLNPVDHATSLLAQTLSGKEHDERQKFEMHPGDRLRINSHFGKQVRADDILEEDEYDDGNNYTAIDRESASRKLRPLKTGRRY